MDAVASLDELRAVLERVRSGFVLRRLRLDEMPAWRLHDGALSHVSGGFFSVVGARFADGEGVFLYQPQSALTGLLTTEARGVRHVLLQARAEPGTLGTAQFGPTIQSTPANYLRLHGGKSTPYVEWFTTHRADVRILHDSMQLDLGERYLFKSKRLVVAECPPDTPVAEGYVWVPAPVLTEAVAEPAFLNIDLRSLLAVHPWGEGGGLVPAGAEVRASLRAPLRAEVLGRILAGLPGEPERFRFADLNALKGWEIREDGIHERGGEQGFDVIYVHVEASGREVAAWSQPLVDSRSEGYAGLACRIVSGALEMRVRCGEERGLQTGAALLPTVLRYPGMAGEAPLRGTVLARSTESDEGGRFFRDASTYELVLTDAVPDSDPASAWLRVSELKWLLHQSNLCSIQLRGLASHLLGMPACA